MGCGASSTASTGRLESTGLGNGAKVAPAQSPLALMLTSKHPKLACNSTMKHHSDSITCLVTSKDGSTLVSGCWDYSLAVWDISTKQPTCTLLGHTDIVHGVVLTMDGCTVISCSSDCTMRVWGLLAGASSSICTQVVECESSVHCMALSDDNTLLASGHHDHCIAIWIVENSAQYVTALQPHTCGPLLGHLDVVRSLVMTHDGKTLVSGSADMTIRVWLLPDGNCLRTLPAHTNCVLGLALTPDDATLVSTSYDNDRTIKVWDLATGSQQACLDGGTWRVAVSDDGSALVSIGHGDTGGCDGGHVVMVWDLPGVLREPSANHQPRVACPYHEMWFYAVAVSCGGSRIFTGQYDGTIQEFCPSS